MIMEIVSTTIKGWILWVYLFRLCTTTTRAHDLSTSSFFDDSLFSIQFNSIGSLCESHRARTPQSSPPLPGAGWLGDLDDVLLNRRLWEDFPFHRPPKESNAHICIVIRRSASYLLYLFDRPKNERSKNAQDAFLFHTDSSPIQQKSPSNTVPFLRSHVLWRESLYSWSKLHDFVIKSQCMSVHADHRVFTISESDWRLGRLDMMTELDMISTEPHNNN